MRARKVVRRLKGGLTEDERYAVAEHVLSQLKEQGDPRGLNKEATSEPGHSTPDVSVVRDFETGGGLI
jgi:hypothetical protein